jgi:uncharacterized membrane protein
MYVLRIALLTLDILLTAAIAGFFYAYSSSVMIGFDAADPMVAIPAMQAINANIRNPIFAPSFFGPALIGLLLLLCYFLPPRSPARWLALPGFGIYLAGGLALTLAINVPMNETLAVTALPADASEAARTWAGYSRPWTAWNHVRTLLSFASLTFLVCALVVEFASRGRR